MADICSECGYPLKGNEEKCPECGEKIEIPNNKNINWEEKDNWDYFQYISNTLFERWYFPSKNPSEKAGYAPLNDFLMLLNLICRIFWRTIGFPILIMLISCFIGIFLPFPYIIIIITGMGVILTILIISVFFPRALKKYWIPLHRTWRRINKRYWINMYKAIKTNNINTI